MSILWVNIRLIITFFELLLILINETGVFNLRILLAECSWLNSLLDIGVKIGLNFLLEILLANGEWFWVGGLTRLTFHRRLVQIVHYVVQVLLFLLLCFLLYLFHIFTDFFTPSIQYFLQLWHLLFIILNLKL